MIANPLRGFMTRVYNYFLSIILILNILQFLLKGYWDLFFHFFHMMWFHPG